MQRSKKTCKKSARNFFGEIAATQFYGLPMAYGNTVPAQGTVQKNSALSAAICRDSPPAANLLARAATIAGGAVHTHTPQRKSAKKIDE